MYIGNRSMACIIKIEKPVYLHFLHFLLSSKCEILIPELPKTELQEKIKLVFKDLFRRPCHNNSVKAFLFPQQNIRTVIQ